MSNTIGKFTYVTYAPNKGDMPFNAIVMIGLKSWKEGEQGNISLTPHLMTEAEIDWYINALKADLGRVGRLAKRDLKRANDRTLAELRE